MTHRRPLRPPLDSIKPARTLALSPHDSIPTLMPYLALPACAVKLLLSLAVDQAPWCTSVDAEAIYEFLEASSSFCIVLLPYSPTVVDVSYLPEPTPPCSEGSQRLFNKLALALLFLPNNSLSFKKYYR